jgi:hypothetical protein
MNRGFWPLAGVQTPRAKGRISLIHVIDKNAIKRTDHAVSGMARNLQLSPISDKMSHSVGRFALFFTGPLSLKIKYLRVETKGAFEIRGFDHRNNYHDIHPGNSLPV